LIRENLIPKCAAADLIVYALPGAYDAEFSTLGFEIQELAMKLTPATES
jgi:hypothetical protein